MGWIWNSGCSWFDGALVDDGDDGTEGEPGAEVSFGEVAMEKQSVWNDFVNLRKLLGNAGKNTNAKQI